MGMLDREPRFAECVGVPIFYITNTVLEHVGDGNIMLTGYVPQRGVLIPQYQSVMSYKSMLCAGTNAVLKAQNVMMEMGMASSGAH